MISSVQLVLLALASTALADISPCPEETCPEKNFMFTCTGSDDQTWVILDRNDVQVINYTIVDSGLSVGQNDTFGDNDQFMVQLVTDNSTRLWFRANPNYDGYAVQCVDDDGDMDTPCGLQVFGPPTMPENFRILTNTVTRISVRLSWGVPLDYDCMITYYNIMVNGRPYNASGSNTSFDLPVEFGTEYCPTISARDAAMRSGSAVASVPPCIDIDTPPAVTLNTNMYSFQAGEFVNITVSWMVPATNTPSTTNYTVRYNETYRNEMGSGSGDDDGDDNVRTVMVQGDQTSVFLRGSFRERGTYFVEVTASNIFGAGDATRRVFTIPTAPTTMPPQTSGGLTIGAIIGIVIGAIVGLILIAVIVVVVIVVIVMVTRKRAENKNVEMSKL